MLDTASLRTPKSGHLDAIIAAIEQAMERELATTDGMAKWVASSGTSLGRSSDPKWGIKLAPGGQIGGHFQKRRQTCNLFQLLMT